jgi:hypothetical protein
MSDQNWVTPELAWADFGFRCPACGFLHHMGDDWDLGPDGEWTLADEHRHFVCSDASYDPVSGFECDVLLSIPTVRTVGP